MPRMMKKKFQCDAMEANMTPMIDVVFNLLIFFMCATKFRQVEGKIEANLPVDEGPKSKTVELKEKETIKIYIDPKREDLAGRAVTESCPVKTETMAEDAICQNVRLQIDSKLVTNFDGMYNELLTRSKIGSEPPVVEIKCKKYVPFYFVAHTLNACKKARLDNIKFTMPEIDHTGKEPITW